MAGGCTPSKNAAANQVRVQLSGQFIDKTELPHFFNPHRVDYAIQMITPMLYHPGMQAFSNPDKLLTLDIITVVANFVVSGHQTT
jgi:hypothetical protein